MQGQEVLALTLHQQADLKTHNAVQCLARTQQLEKRVTCGVSLLVRLARAGRCDPLTKGLALGPLGEMPMVVNASTPGVALGSQRGCGWQSAPSQ